MKTITASQLRQKLKEGQEVHLLDVREPWEHEEFHIGGRLIPIGQLPARLAELEDWKDSEIVCYCRSGNRSQMACLLLEQAGFRQVTNLEGGMLAWQSESED